MSGEAFEDSYSFAAQTDEIIHVDAYVPGCPPSPQAIANALVGLSKAKPKLWLAPEGFRGMPEVDAEKCSGCGACAQVCPTSAIELTDSENKRAVKFKYEKCIACASCEETCPEEAIGTAVERPPAARDRKAIGASVEVELQRCSVCGSVFAPSRQLQEAVDDIVEEVGEYKKYRESIAQSTRICLKCRDLIENVSKAKALLFKLNEAV